MEFKKHILDNGLAVIGEVNPFAKSAAVGFFVRTGSRDEDKIISGVSHFLEHMTFKGTDKLGPLDVNKAFDDTGAQFNAFTSEENTVYYSAVLPEYLEDVTKLWIELGRPSLRDEDFNMEKNVIKEEIAMYEDTPTFDVIDRARSLYFDTHPCGNSILGTRETIDAMSAEQMRVYHQNRYSPNNITLVFAGNFDFDKMLKLASDACSAWQYSQAERKITDYPGKAQTKRIEKQNLVREHICLISPAVSMQDERRFAASLLANIIGDSTGSRYYWALVDKALAEVATMQCESMDGTGAYYSYIRCDRGSTQKVLRKVKILLEDLTNSGIEEDELDKAKNKILSALVLHNEVPMGRLVTVGFNWVYLKQYRTTHQDVEDIKSVTVEDVNTLIRELKPGNFTQYSLGPAR
ncbi:MAG: insulinase family protein [Sedimentisphaerales bacterium]|nr:insulinase family protein [Sedimentisphaerales bacterium]